jgi:CBS domain containing-hemolysin-like protein
MGQTVAGRPDDGREQLDMSTWQTVALVVVLVGLAGLITMAEAALASFSRARADELVAEERAGAKRLAQLVSDPARYLNTALFLRLTTEIGAVVLVTSLYLESVEPRWAALLASVATMAVISYVVIGVGPRTLGRQRADRVALAAAAPLTVATRLLGPVSSLLILLGNALTPGRGFRQGPFASEAELRELVDMAEASMLIEADERQMIHSVFELGDTLTREVMVPRTDMVFIERDKTLRQCLSLALRSGFSRIPVTGEGIDDVVGVAYLKDVVRRVYDNHDAETIERVESVMRTPIFVPDSKPVDDLLREMQSARTHVAVVIDEYGGTAGLVTIEDVLEEIVGEIDDEYDRHGNAVEQLADGSLRVSSRLNIEELGEMFGLELSDDDVDSVGGLLAKALGRVPIPGARADVGGLRLQAESTAGRRNRVDTVLVSPVEDADDREESEAR